MDLMERLAAADPLRDEQLSPDDQREADALLARLLATPVARPRRARRRALVVVAAACAALAAVAAIDLLGSGTPGSGVIDRAVAAVTRGGVVYHVVEFTTGRGSDVPTREVISESWYTSDGRLHRKAFTVRDGRRGRLAEDFAGRRLPGRAGGSALRWDGSANTITESGFAGGNGDTPSLDSFADPGTQLRALQSQGKLRVDGTTSVDGRRVYRLGSGKLSVDGYDWEIEYTVDAQSYLPLARHLTYHMGEGRTVEVLTRYRVYERLPLDAQTRRLLALDPHPKAKCSEFAHELTEQRDLGFPNPCARR
jgi:hypothetical protein